VFYRRAENLIVDIRACALDGNGPLARVRRADGRDAVQLTLDELRRLSSLSDWRSAAELGTDDAALVPWERAGVVYWTDGPRPSRVLSGAVTAGSALSTNLLAEPLVLRSDGSVDALEFMPRLGELGGAKLGGFELPVHSWSQVVEKFRFTYCRKHAEMLRDLWPRLDGRAIERSPLVDLLAAAGLLEEHTPSVAARPSAATITWLGHAAVLFESATTRLLVDPLFHARSIPGRASDDIPPDWRNIGRVDAILITHGDHDHLDVRALSHIPRDTPVIIPRAAERRAHQVDIAAILALLGFTDVREVVDWQHVTIGDIEVVAAPFLGEDWGLLLAKATFVLRAPDATIYLAADSAFMPEVYARLADEFTIDLALVGISGCAEPMVAPWGFGYGNFYQGWLDDKTWNKWMDFCAGPKESAEAAVLMKAKRAFGYAAGGANYHQLAYSDRGTHAELAAFLDGKPCRPVALPLGQPHLVSSL
jgi:L-ascorbate metabolism protein UlaG (beta-lactamase superfamily)